MNKCPPSGHSRRCQSMGARTAESIIRVEQLDEAVLREPAPAASATTSPTTPSVNLGQMPFAGPHAPGRPHLGRGAPLHPPPRPCATRLRPPLLGGSEQRVNQANNTDVQPSTMSLLAGQNGRKVRRQNSQNLDESLSALYYAKCRGPRAAPVRARPPGPSVYSPGPGGLLGAVAGPAGKRLAPMLPVLLLVPLLRRDGELDLTDAEAGLNGYKETVS